MLCFFSQPPFLAGGILFKRRISTKNWMGYFTSDYQYYPSRPFFFNGTIMESGPRYQKLEFTLKRKVLLQLERKSKKFSDMLSQIRNEAGRVYSP